jgi:alkylhydroperoxidase family enzyme
MGVSEDDLADLHRYRTSDRFSEAETLVLDLTVAMGSTPAEVPDELRDQLLRHFSKGQLAEIASTIAWENHRARLNRALGVRSAGFSEGAFCALPEHRAEHAGVEYR